LNSVLEDNKLLTLPSGERLNIPDNLRIILEVDSLEQATPATVSRCGMVWFSKDVVTDDMCLQQMMNSLKKLNVLGDDASENVLPAQNSFLDAIEPLVLSPSEEGSIPRRPSFVEEALEFSLSQTHIMPPTREKLVSTLKSLLIRGIQKALEYDENHPDLPISGEYMNNFAARWLPYSLLWSFSGSATWEV